MGLLDRLLGRLRDRGAAGWGSSGRDTPYYGPGTPSYGSGTLSYGPGTPSYGQGSGQTENQAAIERYRYLLRTAPPEAIEQAHAEAFAKLTPQQRRQVLAEIGAAVPPSERAASDDPASLARMATRAELRQPGILERVLGRGGGGMGGGIGLGGVIAGGLLASVAGAFVGTAIAQELFDEPGGDYAAGDGGYGGDGGGADAGQDGGGWDAGGGDFGGGDVGGF